MMFGSVTMLTLLVRIARTKVTALELGPDGMASLSQVTDLQGLVGSLLLFGTELGIVAVVTDAYTKRSPTLLESTLRLVRTRLVWPSALLVLAVAASAPWWCAQVLGFEGHTFPIMIALASVALSTAGRVWNSALTGARVFKLLARSQIAEALLSVSVVVPFILLWSLDGALYSLAAANGVYLATRWWAFRRTPPPESGPDNTLTDQVTIRLLMAFGSATIFLGLLGQAGTLLLRRRLIAGAGIDDAGQFQAVFGITQQYATLVLGAMSSFAFPSYRAVSGDRAALCNLTNNVLRGVLLVTVPTLVGLLVCREWVIRVLYASSFSSAEWLLRIQLFGDFFKMAGWAIGGTILASGFLRWHVSIDVLFWLVLLGVAEAALGSLGVAAASIAFVCANFVTFVSVWVFTTHRLDFKINRNNLKLLWLGFATVSGTNASLSLGSLAGYVVGPLLLLVWAVLCIEGSEWRGVREYARSKLGNWRG